MALPDGFKVKTAGNYLRIQEGDTKIRILSKGISGLEAWVEIDGGKKPVRVKGVDDFDMYQRAESRQFLAFLVWDYADSKIKIWVFTQGTIASQLMSLEDDPDFGDLMNYDIKVTRKGKGFNDTEYSVKPLPPKPLDDQIKEEVKVGRVNLQALYSTEKDPYGGDPFAVTNIQEEILDGPKSTKEKLEELGDNL